MSQLAQQQCVPCKGGVPPLNASRIDELLEQVQGWSSVDNHHITKSFKFSNFAEALDFVNRVGAIAEEQGHHPDIYLTYGKARIDLCTHKIDGLTESDFILAAKIDQL